MFKTLLHNIEVIQDNKETLLDAWMQCEDVHKTLSRHGFEISFFKDKFASKVLEFNISVIKSENKLGNCPIIGVMLLLFKKKHIPLSDIFMICVQLKNTLLTFMYKNSILNKYMIEEIALLMDYNFKSLINEYVSIYYDDDTTKHNLQTRHTKITQNKQKHTQKPVYISAPEYLKEVHIEMELIEELAELESDTLDAIDAQEIITQNSLIESAHLFEKYSKVVNMMYDFEELSYTLSILKELLSTTEVDSIDETILPMVTTYLKAIIKDLQSWRAAIFVTKEAPNIHYLDKTLMSSIAQLEILLMPQNNKVENEIEFF